MPQDFRLCVWSVPIAMILIFAGLLPAMHFLPPLAPSLDAQAFQAIYRGNSVGIRIGAILLTFGISFLIPFFAAISIAMARMAHRPWTLAATQLTAALMAIVPFFLCSFVFTTASFRPERNAELVTLLSDLGWILLVMPVAPVFVQLLSIGVAVLGDYSPHPVFPRWAAYLNFWIALLFLPGAVIALFMRGPFAWNGLLGFWVPLGAFGIWTIAMFVTMLKIELAP